MGHTTVELLQVYLYVYTFESWFITELDRRFGDSKLVGWGKYLSDTGFSVFSTFFSPEQLFLYKTDWIMLNV